MKYRIIKKRWITWDWLHGETHYREFIVEAKDLKEARKKAKTRFKNWRLDMIRRVY